MTVSEHVWIGGGGLRGGGVGGSYQPGVYASQGTFSSEELYYLCRENKGTDQ